MKDSGKVQASILVINNKTDDMSALDDKITTLREGTENYISSAKPGAVIQFQDTADSTTNTVIYVVNKSNGTQLDCKRVTITNSGMTELASIKCDGISIAANDFMRHEVVNIYGSLVDSTVISKNLSQILKSAFTGIFANVTVSKK